MPVDRNITVPLTDEKLYLGKNINRAEKDPHEAHGILLLQEENNLDLAVKIISSCSKRNILCWQIILERRGFLFIKIEGLVDHFV